MKTNDESRDIDEIYRHYSSVEAAEAGAKPGEAFLIGKGISNTPHQAGIKYSDGRIVVFPEFDDFEAFSLFLDGIGQQYREFPEIKGFPPVGARP